MVLDVEKLHETLNLKRDSGKYYNSLKGIGKTVLFLENLTQLGCFNKMTVGMSYYIFGPYLNKVDRSYITMILKSICQSKGYTFEAFKSKQKGIMAFAVDNFLLMFVYQVNDENVGPLSVLLDYQEHKYTGGYILNECEYKDLSNKMHDLINKFKLDKIVFD